MIRIKKGLLRGLVTLALLSPMPALAGDATTTLVVDGMTCGFCVPAVTKALRQVDGVKTVQVSLADKQAVVVAKESVKPDMLIAAVANAGFLATVAERN